MRADLNAIRDSIIDAGGRIILFIDELHTVVGVGGGGGAGGMGAPDILKPALARGSAANDWSYHL